VRLHPGVTARRETLELVRYYSKIPSDARKALLSLFRKVSDAD
jgi:hypothetical protein